ncbi:hypothetical protein QTP86_015891, partial [Hemibagrus guttatus]
QCWIRSKRNTTYGTASKKQIKHVAFGNFFGVLALSQSTRLHKEADVLLECVKLLQSLSQYREYLRDLPRKTMADILNEVLTFYWIIKYLCSKVSEQMFEQVLFSALQEDLSSALSSPEQLELLLLVMRRFSSTLSPAHLDKLLGTASINTHTLSWLSEVVMSAARSMKKECVLPAVASDLLHVSLREDSFTFFWDKVVIDGLMSEPTGPSHTRKQRKSQNSAPDSTPQTEECVARLRNWIIHRLSCIVENHQIKKDEELVMEIASPLSLVSLLSLSLSLSPLSLSLSLSPPPPPLSPHMVLDPSKDEEESGVLVTDDNDTQKKRTQEEEEDEEQEAEDEEEPDSSDNDEEDDNESMEEEEEEVDQNFRLELMKVLQGQNALATEEDGSEDEELDDEAMMKLDKNLEALFGEQKKKLQAKKDEKERLRKEKTLVRDFKIKVLDLLDVFLCKQGSSVLVLGLVEPLLSVIENCMNSESGQHEQDFLRRAAHIFRQESVCVVESITAERSRARRRSFMTCWSALVGRAQKLSDSSVALYYFSAALYLLKVLRGVMKDSKDTAEAQACVMVLRALPCKEVKQLMSEAQWTETLQKVEFKNKSVHEKTVKALELAHFLIKTVHLQKLGVKLEDLRNVLRSMNADGSLQKSGTLEDTYWSVMKLFGLQKPKVEKVKKVTEEEKTEQEEEPKKKKKGFLPESKETQKPQEACDPGGGKTLRTHQEEEERRGKRRERKIKRKRSESETQNQPPVKKTKAQHPQSNVEKKQKKKMKSGGKSSAE